MSSSVNEASSGTAMLNQKSWLRSDCSKADGPSAGAAGAAAAASARDALSMVDALNTMTLPVALLMWTSISRTGVGAAVSSAPAPAPRCAPLPVPLPLPPCATSLSPSSWS